MTTEEKVMAYDKAIENAKRLYEQGTITESLVYIFPELRESEDERIRKAIIKALRSCANPVNSLSYDGFQIEDVIAWLEKQNGQKATTVWHDVSEVPDEMQEILVEWESPDATWHNIAFYDAETKAFRYLKQPISNVTRWAYVSDILTQSATKISDKGWSEEDEEELGIAIKYLQQAGQWDSATWLKSLKERLSKR